MNYHTEAYGAIPAATVAPLGGLFAYDESGEELDIFDNPAYAEAEPEVSPEEEIDEEIIIEPELEDSEPAQTVCLRPYQETSVTSILTEFKRKVKRTLCVSATGTGKAVMLADLARRAHEADHGVLILVHRDELIRQLAKSIGRLGIAPLVEKADERALGGFGMFSKVVVGSVQTLRGKRLEQWPKDAFKLVIIDECFPPGTLVNGTPIEAIKAGDYVDSYNHETRKIESRRVVRLFKNPAKSLVRLHLSNGESIVCTPDHPVAVLEGDSIEYKPASVTINCYTVVHGKQRKSGLEDLRYLSDGLSAKKLESFNGTDVLGSMQGNEEGDFAETGTQETREKSRGFTVPQLLERCRLYWGQFIYGHAKPALLLEGMQCGIFGAAFIGANGQNQSKICFRPDEEKQPYVKPRGKSQTGSDIESDGVETSSAWREWRVDNSAKNAFRSFGLANRSSGVNWRKEGERESNSYQNRHCERGFEDCCGSGRQLTPDFERQSGRQVENGVLRGPRVVRVEVLEPPGSGEFGEVCPDGFVYNIEVEGNHNYFVDNTLVHNCHHALLGNSYGTVLKHFGLEDDRLRVAGFTATADRLDGENIGQIFESLAFEYNIQDATRDGWLVPIEAIQVKTNPKINLKDLRTTAGDFNQGDLEREINDNIGVLVNALADTNALEKRRTIAFTPNISSARALAQALSDVGISARAVAGADHDRAAKFKAHQNGEFQVLCNCAVATEGYDDPAIEAVLICRPTKSRALYSQMVGRGTRLFEDRETGYVKKNCRVVDFAFITGKHKLVSPVDLYDNSETPDEVVDAAKELLAAGGVQTLDLALEQAQAEYEEKRRVRIQRRTVAVSASKFDPLTAMDIYGIPQKAGAAWENTTPLSEKQKLYLEKRAISTEGMTKAIASKLISKIEARKEHGWANPWQVRDMIQTGLDPSTATGMREREATDYLSSNPVMATDGQIRFLRRLGYQGDPHALTKKEAIAAISSLKTEGS